MANCKVVLLSCGSFNPPTNMHLRIFEVARDHLQKLNNVQVVGGVVSPVHDAYAKKELESSTHRIDMLKLALRTSEWIRLSEWEANQEGWSKTLQVLQYHQNTLNSLINSNNKIEVNQENGLNLPYSSWISNEMLSVNEPIIVKLVCGGDLLESFSTPGLWKDSDIDTIVGQHGLVVVGRNGTNPLQFIYESDQLTRYQNNIIIVPEWVTNEISSTKVRRALRRQQSVKYLIDDAVIDHICKHGLYGSLPSRFYMLTPSPSDVNMLSASPNRADDDINLQLHPILHLDQPDATTPIDKFAVKYKQECKREFKLKNETEVVQYPGKAVQILAVEGTASKTKKVGFVEDFGSAKKVVTSMKSAPEIQKIVLDPSVEKSPKKTKKSPRLSDPTRSRNVFKRSNSDVPQSQSNPELEATPVKIEITREGVRVISDKESIV